MNSSNLASAQAAVKDLFAALAIQRVISVDDLYLQEHTADDLIGLLTEVPTAAAAIPDLSDIDLTADADVWHQRVRDRWGTITAEKQLIILQQTRAATGKAEELDNTAGGVLAQLFTQYDFRALTLAEWKDQKAALLEGTTMPNTVVLFDQSFTKEGGTETAGLDMIKDAYTLCQHPGLVCGLLSQAYTIDQEFDSWQQLAKDHNLETHQFVLIAKERLNGHLLGFATQIKLTVLNKRCNELKEHVINLLYSAHEQAASDLRSINIYDFEHIVFRSSHREGVWEPDTLFRIFGLYHRKATRQRAKGSLDLTQGATEIRRVSNLPIANDTTLRDQSWKIQRLEFYDEAQYLNAHYLPTDLGDVYQKTNGDKSYILLAQPCDLMVRNDAQPGRRPSVYEATLAEIVSEQQRPKDQYASVELRYFDPVTGQRAYVHLGRTHTVKLCVLDLCAFRADGTAELSTNDQCPETVIPSWQRYFQELKQEAAKLLKRYQELKKSAGKDKALIALLMRPNFKGILTGDLDPNTLTVHYNLKRVRRLLQPRAGELLSRFAIYKTRYAFEHDFGAEPETLATARVPTGAAEAIERGQGQPEGAASASKTVEPSGIIGSQELK